MPKICDDLRQAVLQEAIQGKLTEQLKSDGNARDLLKQIAEEKAQLIKDKKIKKEKPLPEITEDEVPFDIPENWVWVRLPEIATSGLGKTLNAAKDTGVVKEYLCSINIYWEGISLAKVKTAPFSEGDIEKYRLEKGDLLICEGGDVGRSAIWDEAKEMYYQNALHRVRFYGNINQYYFLWIFKFYKHLGVLNEVSKGETIKHLVQGSLYSLVFPLPPLAEQQRIVAKVEKLMAEIDELEKIENELTALKEAFPGDMKAALLQEAMQGKLTEQLKSDGNARDLLKEIKAEKDALVKAGKLKKEKPLAEISEDEIPFDIPENWEWVRLGTIAKKLVDGDHNPPSGVVHKTEYMMLSSQNINNRLVNMDKVRYLTKEIFDKENVRTNLQKGDILFTSVGTLGRSCVYEDSYNLCFQRSVSVIASSINSYYLKYFFDSPFSQNTILDKATGTAQKGFYLKELANMLVPLPPLAEQERIVAKLDKLLPLVEGLKEA